MRRASPGINVALSLAVERIRPLFEQVPEHLRPDLAGERWQDLEWEIDQACGKGDEDRALLAIEGWYERTATLLRRLLEVPT